MKMINYHIIESIKIGDIVLGKARFKIKSKKPKSKGFTHAELLVAISIMGIIMIITLPQISNIQQHIIQEQQKQIV